jgi:hypothetical protein
MTECSGVNCLFRELVNPEPQTIAFYVVILALLFYARGRSGRSEEHPKRDNLYEGAYEDFNDEIEPKEEDDDLPAPVLAQEDDDDDLELLDELDDL